MAKFGSSVENEDFNLKSNINSLTTYRLYEIQTSIWEKRFIILYFRMTFLMSSHHRQPSNTSHLKKSGFCIKWKSTVLLLVTASCLLLGILGIVTWKFILPTGASQNKESHYGESIEIVDSKSSASCASNKFGKYT